MIEIVCTSHMHMWTNIKKLMFSGLVEKEKISDRMKIIIIRGLVEIFYFETTCT